MLSKTLLNGIRVDFVYSGLTALYISVASVVIHHGDSNDADGVTKSTTINLYGPQILFLVTA